MFGLHTLAVMKPHYNVYAVGLGFLLGIVGGNFFIVTPFYGYAFLLGIGGLYILTHRKYLLLIFFLVGIFLALVRWYFFIEFSQQNNVRALVDKQQTFIVQVDAEPDQRTDKQLLTVKVKISAENKWQQGLVLVTTSLYPKYQYGDIIFLQGTLSEPAIFSDFNYQRYLARHGIYAVSYFPDMKFIKSEQSAYKTLLVFKNKLIRQVSSMLAEPEASFLNGLLWGAKKSMFAPVLEKFNLTGTTHVVALSGYNITILGLIIFFIMPWLGVGRKKAFWVTLGIICLFVLITGYPASVVRAAIMGIMVLIAYRWGGGVKPGILLIVSATIMCALNPFLLLWDVGFQLSFLATIGLVYLMPQIEKYFFWLTPKFGLRETVLATTSVIVMTTPLILYQFGRFSLVALPANILILFVIPLAMALGFLAVLISYIWFPLGQMIAWCAFALLHYVIFVTNVLSSHAYVTLSVSLSLATMLVIYIIFFIFIFYVNRKKTSSF